MGLKFYETMWKKYSDTAARQLCWEKSSNLRKTTFCERKTRNKSTQIGINSAKTQNNDDFCQNCHIFAVPTNAIAQRCRFVSPAEHL